VTDAEREKLYAAKAAMRRYVRMASIELKALNKLVDEVRTPADFERALREIKTVVEANGFGEAFANLVTEIKARDG